MRIGMLVLAAITYAALAACTSTGTFMRPYAWYLSNIPCPGDCSVNVTVTENSVDKTCIPDSVDPIVVTGNNGIRTITWTLGSGYVFSNESYKFGLFVKVDPQGKFKSAQVKQAGKALELKFDHNKRQGEPQAIFPYALTVQRDDGSFCTTLDPWLIS